MFCRTQRQHFHLGHMGLKYENQDYTLASGSPVLASFSGFAHISVFSEWLLHPIRFDRSDRPPQSLLSKAPRCPVAPYVYIVALSLLQGSGWGWGCP